MEKWSEGGAGERLNGGGNCLVVIVEAMPVRPSIYVDRLGQIKSFVRFPFVPCDYELICIILYLNSFAK